MLLPISALSQRIKDNAPSLIGMLVLIALSVSLAWQSAELLRLVRGPVQQPLSQTAPDLQQRAQAPIAQLFGSPRQAMLSQVPMLMLMMAFTVFGLWILAQPITGAEGM